MKAHPSCNHCPLRIGASQVKAGFCYTTLSAVLGPLGVALFPSPHHSAPHLFAHPTRWFTWFPSITYFHTLWVLCFSALEWPSYTSGVFYSLPRFQPPALVQWAKRVPVLFSSSLFHSMMNHAWPSDITQTAATEPLLFLLPSTSHSSDLPNIKKSREQMPFYSCLRSFYISFASRSKVLFLIIQHKTLYSLSLSLSLFSSLPPSPHTYTTCCVT